MARNEFSYKIKAKDESKRATQSASRNMEDMESSAKKVGDTLKKAFTVGAIIAVGAKIKDVGRELVQAYAAQERAERQLAAAASNNPYLNEGSVRRLERFASELQQVTTVGDEVTISFAGMLASFGRTEEEIQAVISAAADLSAATGMSLDSAVRNLNKTFGGLSGELGELIPEVKDLTEEQLRAGEAVELIAGQFDGLAEQMTQSVDGSISQFNNAFGDLKENLGSLVSGALMPLREELTKGITAWNNYFAAANDVELLAQLTAALRGGTISSGQAQTGLATAESSLGYVNNQIEELEDKLENWGIGDFLGGGGLGSRRAAEENLERLRQQQETLAGVLEEFRAAVAAIPEQETRLPGQTGGGGPAGEAAAGLKDFNDKLKLINDKLKLINGKMKDTTSTVEQFGQAFTETDAGMASGGAGGGKDLDKEMAKAKSALDRQDPKSPTGIDLSGVLGPLMEFGSQISSVAAILDPLKVVFDGMLSVIGPALNEALAPLIGVFFTMGELLGKILVPVFDIVGRAAQALATVFVWLYNNVFRHIGNVIIKFFGGVFNTIIGAINIFISAINALLGFAGVNIGKLKGFDVSSNLLGEISLGDVTSAGEDYTGTGDSGAGASYTTGRNITINMEVYTDAIVGEDGFRQFSLMVRDEIYAAEALGA